MVGRYLGDSRYTFMILTSLIMNVNRGRYTVTVIRKMRLYLNCRILQEMPRNVMGKVNKKDLMKKVFP